MEIETGQSRLAVFLIVAWSSSCLELVEQLLLWRGDLSPLGCVAALKQRTQSSWHTELLGLGLLRSPAGINPLATGFALDWAGWRGWRINCGSSRGAWPLRIYRGVAPSP
ncbi:Hypothetical protein PSEBR_m483 [Pseudomonas brassicacearum subsp. brassicacearum NFM421]|uniref:Uncharacterized protein n=1 Tax=Pseudomonas brassicacearum (strain NFM421) TaxID=994484 RepID=F2K8Y2_PSEBN|nr:Hypothetical protein PSEBR_m483 [Pseudomonas brassicacearum subsp. brassicacearum NFM421]